MGYELFSNGPDRSPGTADDIFPWSFSERCRPKVADDVPDKYDKRIGRVLGSGPEDDVERTLEAKAKTPILGCGCSVGVGQR